MTCAPSNPPPPKDKQPVADPPQRRFYESVSLVETPQGWQVQLDGRTLRTPLRRAILLPHALAETMVDEWAAQEEFILPLTMPLTRLVNSAIDGVADQSEAVKRDIASIAAGDLIFYRADEPQGLVADQVAAWDSVLAWARGHFDVPLVLGAGIMPVRQDERFAERVLAVLPDDPLALTALHQLSALTGSGLLALMFAERRVDFDTLWRAAHVDEDWNIKQWGADDQAAERRASRERDARAAALIATHVVVG